MEKKKFIESHKGMMEKIKKGKIRKKKKKITN